MTSIRPVSSIWCSICTTNAVSFPNLHWETDSQIKELSGRWGRCTAYITGQVIEIDQPVSSQGYLESKYVGGGVLTELLSNAGTLKSALITLQGDQASISLPTENFLSVGDIVTVVKDDDGCELYYQNHSRQHNWSSGRSPKSVREYYRAARFAINGGFFGAILIGIPAGLATGQSPTLNSIALSCLTVAIVAAVWSLTMRPLKISRHGNAAIAMADQEARLQEKYIKDKNLLRIDRLSKSVGNA